MIAAPLDLAKLIGDNATPEHKRFLDQFEAMDQDTQREMLRRASAAAAERLSTMLFLARRAS